MAIDESKLDERIRGYDWQAVFEYCGVLEDTDYSIGAGNQGVNVSVALGSNAAPAGFQRIDVAEVIATSDGERDERSWLGVFKLSDGRFAFASASCDYTGWDCQASGYAIVSHDLQHLIQFGLGADDRARLGLEANP